MYAMDDEISAKGPGATANQVAMLKENIGDSLTHNHDSFFHMLGFLDKAQLGLDIFQYTLNHAMAPSGIPLIGGHEVADIESYDMIDELRNPKRSITYEPSGPGM
jgi:hypothetical protein